MASYSIGKLLGIQIELDVSFVFLLLVLLFFSAVFQSIYTFLLVVLLFVCVLVHELTHSVTAIRNGIRVKKIVLLPIGGVSVLAEAEIKPDVEFRIAIVGPLMSLFLGGVFGMLVTISPLGLATQTLQFLFEINLLLGIFNLLPAFPTDGGRVFRSYLEKRHNEYEATMLTVKASKYVMGLFLAGTLVYLAFISAPFTSKWFLFFWNLIIVMFLYGGATAEQQFAEIKKDAGGLRVGDAISRHFKLVRSSTSLRALYSIARSSGEHIFVTKIGKEYAYLNLLKKAELSGRVAADIATPIPSVAAGKNVVTALQELGSSEVGIAAVVSGRRLLGIVTLAQLQSFISLHALQRQKHLKRN